MAQDETDGEMAATTETVRDRDFRTLECDIPADLTIREYREARSRRPRLTRLPRLLRRRERRRDAAA